MVGYNLSWMELTENDQRNNSLVRKLRGQQTQHNTSYPADAKLGEHNF